VVGLLALLAAITGAAVLTLTTLIALYVGTPPWAAALGVLLVLTGVAVAVQHVRRSAARPW
jgi:hypothetical protein